MMLSMKRTTSWQILLLTTLILWQNFLFASPKDNQLKILFVGNSYTYYWNLPQSLQAMAKAQNIHWTVRNSTAPGASWKDHWTGEKSLNTKAIITDGDWDYVVLQNHSLSTIDTPDEFDEYGDKFIELVKQSGAKAILYMTWARQHNPLMLKTISAKYNELAIKHNVTVVPIGAVWNHILKLRPDIQLHTPDKSHPTPLGTFVNTRLFYRLFSDDQTTEVSNALTTEDAQGHKLYITVVDENNAKFIHDAIRDFYSEI